ncbi:hypothetical protein [Flagellimonas sp. S3867]|uniref:hypothetical protein n=1 Tax=Flagellimonas sp. S3867 TaxID=2768063 RepID=UPI0016849435|nr:hypothetical protein [Flagellimonas sp. S3867]
MMKKLPFLCTFLIQICTAQIQNSSGNTLFFTDRAEQVNVKATGSEKSQSFELGISAKLNSLFWNDNWSSIRYYGVDTKRNGISIKGKADSTVSTSSGLIFKGGLSSKTGIFKESPNNKWFLSAGIIKGTDKINRYAQRKTAYSFGLAMKYTYENRSVFYDTISMSKNAKYASTISIDGHLELYPRWKAKGASVGFTGGYRRDTNADDLNGFQDLPLAFTDALIAQLSHEDGKIGRHEYQNNFYASASLPWFFYKQRKDKPSSIELFLGKTAIVPFCHVTFGDRKVLNPGVSLSFADIGMNRDSFQDLFASSFHIGLDWIQKDGEWSGPILFFGGNITSKKLFKHTPIAR